MGARTERVRATHPTTWNTLPHVLRLWQRRAHRATDVALLRVASRRTQARLALTGVPLAVAASLMAGAWFLLPLLAACAWWWAPSTYGWEWLEAVGRGVLTTEWAFLGAGALATFPGERLAIGAVWIALPLAFVGCTGPRPRRE
jgi:hypothetical protein